MDSQKYYSKGNNNWPMSLRNGVQVPPTGKQLLRPPPPPQRVPVGNGGGANFASNTLASLYKQPHTKIGAVKSSPKQQQQHHHHGIASIRPVANDRQSHLLQQQKLLQLHQQQQNKLIPKLVSAPLPVVHTKPAVVVAPPPASAPAQPVVGPHHHHQQQQQHQPVVTRKPPLPIVLPKRAAMNRIENAQHSRKPRPVLQPQPPRLPNSSRSPLRSKDVAPPAPLQSPPPLSIAKSTLLIANEPWSDDEVVSEKTLKDDDDDNDEDDDENNDVSSNLKRSMLCQRPSVPIKKGTVRTMNPASVVAQRPQRHQQPSLPVVRARAVNPPTYHRALYNNQQQPQSIAPAIVTNNSSNGSSSGSSMPLAMKFELAQQTTRLPAFNNFDFTKSINDNLKIRPGPALVPQAAKRKSDAQAGVSLKIKTDDYEVIGEPFKYDDYTPEEPEPFDIMKLIMPIPPIPPTNLADLPLFDTEKIAKGEVRYYVIDEKPVIETREENIYTYDTIYKKPQQKVTKEAAVGSEQPTMETIEETSTDNENGN